MGRKTKKQKQKLLMNRLTLFPLKSFPVKGHHYHPKLGARQTVDQQHSPEIIQGEQGADENQKIRLPTSVYLNSEIYHLIRNDLQDT